MSTDPQTVSESAVLALAIDMSDVADHPRQLPHARIPEAWLALPAGVRARFMDDARRQLEGRPSFDDELLAEADRIRRESGEPESSKAHICPPMPDPSDVA